MSRIVTVSLNPEPKDYDGDVWIQADEDRVYNYIRAAIRMAPDKLVVDNTCFGLFGIV